MAEKKVSPDGTLLALKRNLDLSCESEMGIQRESHLLMKYLFMPTECQAPSRGLL